MRYPILALTLLLGLACGGLPPLPGGGGPPCSPDHVAWSLELAELAGPIEEVPPGPVLEIGPDGLRVRGQEVEAGPDALRRALAEASAGTIHPELLVVLAVAPEVPGERLVPVLDALQELGITRVRFLLRSPETRAPTVFVDPAYAEELEGRLATLPPADRMVAVAGELDSLLLACPSGRAALQEVAFAAPESRCELLFAMMQEALVGCPLTSGAKVATALQVGFQPPPYAIVGLDLTLDPNAAPFPVDPAAPWSALAGQWLPQDGATARWVLAGPEPAPTDDPPADRPAGDRPAAGRPTPQRPASAGAPEVTGGLDRATAGKVLQRHRGAIARCYEELLREQPTAAGGLTLRLTVGRDGAVSSAAVDDDGIGSATLNRCLASAAMRITFPAPQGGLATIALPLRFAPQ